MYILSLDNPKSFLKKWDWKWGFSDMNASGEQKRYMCCDESTEYKFEKFTKHIQELWRIIA